MLTDVLASSFSNLHLLTFSSASSLLLSARADQKTALSPSFWKCLAQARLCSLVSRSALFTNSMFTFCSDTSFTYASWWRTADKPYRCVCVCEREQITLTFKMTQNDELKNENQTKRKKKKKKYVCPSADKCQYTYQVRTSEQQRISGIDDLNDKVTTQRHKQVCCSVSSVGHISHLTRAQAGHCTQLQILPPLDHSPQLSPELQVPLERGED